LVEQHPFKVMVPSSSLGGGTIFMYKTNPLLTSIWKKKLEKRKILDKIINSYKE